MIGEALDAADERRVPWVVFRTQNDMFAFHRVDLEGFPRTHVARDVLELISRRSSTAVRTDTNFELASIPDRQYPATLRAVVCDDMGSPVRVIEPALRGVLLTALSPDEPSRVQRFPSLALIGPRRRDNPVHVRIDLTRERDANTGSDPLNFGELDATW